MPTFHNPTLTSTDHAAATDTAIDLWDTLPGAPSAESDSIPSGCVIGYRRSGKITLLIADRDANVWREVVGAPLLHLRGIS